MFICLFIFIIQIKLTDFGLAGDVMMSKRRGGTPMYASENAFGGDQRYMDFFAYGRIHLFLALDWSDFIQLSFMPIEDDQMLETVRNGIQSFKIIKNILKCLKTGYKDNFEDMSKLSKLKITRSDLISAGIPSNWFMDSLDCDRDTIQTENFHCQSLQQEHILSQLRLILIFRSFGAFDYSRTKDLVSTYHPDNPEMSKVVHDQGTTFMCWAYSTTTMIRNTWKFTLLQMEQAVKNGTWNWQPEYNWEYNFDYNAEMSIRESSSTFLEIRNLLLMMVLPKRIHKKDTLQSAYLRAAIARVSKRLD